MAGLLERAVVQDPLALGPDSGTKQVVNIQGGGMSAPATRYAGGNQAEKVQASMGMLGDILAEDIKDRHAELLNEGKMAYQQGKSLQETANNGDYYTSAGYNLLKTKDAANSFFNDQSAAIANGEYGTDPKEYMKKLQSNFKTFNDTLGDDFSKQVASAAFEDYMPRLVDAQFKANSGFNEARTNDAWRSGLGSGAQASGDTPRVVPGGSLAVSPGIVSRPYTSSAEDRDIGIRTMLGEAAGEGDTGLAAVAHVLKNRAERGKFGGTSIKAVAMSPSQFSAWNGSRARGGNNPWKWDANGAAYQKAAAVYDAVMGGHVADMTGGADHYYAPGGMPALVATGAAKGLTPSWAKGGGLKIGGHIFFNKSGKGAISAVDLGASAGMTGVDPDSDSARRGAIPAPTTTAAGAPAPSSTVPSAGGQSLPSVVSKDGGAFLDPEAVKKASANGEYSFDPDVTAANAKALAASLGRDPNAQELSDYNVAHQPTDPPRTTTPETGPANPDHADDSDPTARVSGYVERQMADPRVRPEVKAKLLTEEIKGRLSMGDRAIFDSAGGIGGLGRWLNTDQLAEVSGAWEKFQSAEDSKFDAEKEVRANAYRDRVRNGEPAENVIKSIENDIRAGKMNERWGHGIAQSLYSIVRADKGDAGSAMLKNPAVVAGFASGINSYNISRADVDAKNDMSMDALRTNMYAVVKQATGQDPSPEQQAYIETQVQAVNKKELDATITDVKNERKEAAKDAEAAAKEAAKDAESVRKIKIDSATKELIDNETTKFKLGGSSRGEFIEHVIDGLKKAGITDDMFKNDPVAAGAMASAIAAADQANKGAIDDRIAEVKLLEKKRVDFSKTKNDADQAIATGNQYGKTLTGNVFDTDGHEVPVQEYIEQTIKSNALADARKQFGTDGDQGMMRATAEKIAYEKMSKMGIIDKQEAATASASLQGDLIDKATGQVRGDAMDAFSTYHTLMNNPNIDKTYVKEMYKDADEDTKAVLALASRWTGANTDTADKSLILAQSKVKADPEAMKQALISTSIEFKATKDASIDNVINTKFDKGWFGRILDPKDPFLDRENIQKVVQTGRNNDLLASELGDLADSLKLRYPTLSTEEVMTLAETKMPGRVDRVGDNLIVSRTDSNMAKDLGIDGFGPNASTEAVYGYIEKHAGAIQAAARLDDKQWGQGVSARIGNILTRNWSEEAVPNFNMSYNPSTRTISLMARDPANPGKEIGQLIVLNTDMLAKEYKDSKAIPGIGSRVLNTVNETAAAAIRDERDRPTNDQATQDSGFDNIKRLLGF